jgi:hypothetical protein
MDLKRLSRRGLLKHTALASVLLPVLRRRDARGAITSPRRVIFIFSGNGPIEAAGPASGSELSFTLHDWWRPLERHKADGIFLSHMAATGSGVVVGRGHAIGGQVLSGYGCNEATRWALGETIDQTIAKRLEARGKAGLKRSVTWGLARGLPDAFFADRERPIAPERDPSKAWASLFANFVAPPTSGASSNQAALRLARERSVLDFVHADCKSLRDGLGAEGARLLDDHCTTLRSMELNLNANLANGAGATCSKPGDPGARAWTDPENIDAQLDAFINLMAAALACELTHVVGFQFSGEAARNRLATTYGVPSSGKVDSGDSGPAHHAWTHNGDSPSKLKALGIFTTFYAHGVAKLLDKLKATTDVHGQSLLDSTVVLWVSELGGHPKNRDAHQTGVTPVLLFGRGQGTFKTGRYIQGPVPESPYEALDKNIAGGQDMARILVSLARYMGLDDLTNIGAAGGGGPLPSLYG